MALLETVGYYFWLIPSILSFTCSSILLLNRLSRIPKLSLIGALELLFSIGDMLQCLPWFFGSLVSVSEDRSHDQSCLNLETLFELGIFIKSILATLGVGMLSFYTITKKPLTLRCFMIYFLILVAFLLLCTLLNVYLNGRASPCQNISEIAPSNLSPIEIYYILFFLGPIVFLAVVNILICGIALYYQRSDFISSMIVQHYDRVIMFTLVFCIGYIPTSIFFLVFYTDKVSYSLYCFMGLSASSTGTIASTYLLLCPWLDKMRRFNLFFFIEKLVEDNEIQASSLTQKTSFLTLQDRPASGVS